MQVHIWSYLLLCLLQTCQHIWLLQFVIYTHSNIIVCILILLLLLFVYAIQSTQNINCTRVQNIDFIAIVIAGFQINILQYFTGLFSSVRAQMFNQQTIDGESLLSR